MNNMKLREFLSEGSIIRTKHCNSTSWVTNVVFAINDDWIEIDIGLEKDYIDNIIMVGDIMKCKYTSGDYEFTLIGWVTKIRLDIPQSITIKVHDVEKFANRRDNYRYDIYLCSVIKNSKNDNKGVFAIMTNLSQGGAAFIAKEDIEKELEILENPQGERNFYFEVYVNPKKQLCFTGVIRRKGSNEKGFEYGVKIFDIDFQNEKILNELIDELEKKDKEFYNKRSSFWSKNSKYNR
ncbi:PilZ domain-containing protein [Acetivibrio mesophilus]|uniref:PilZ domain-containing protein n=1 Tax=Acetivibrio mesophilus TaxID=2487273 RepID=A0A4Q0I5S0_9FIRM|nr:PilZ domain-containing protein [Acetivibrio mesophilus]ODM25274.1 pilus assembly protein PilZ [Clostridium sp. Bc-iso-3]RXE59706.1 PilZ domain-containing protein [Acetivibrio mesophilus]HHV28572.1 PilZ domain-containing protein [Clostridium sp.]